VDTHGGGETSFPATTVNSSEPNRLCLDDHSCFAFCDTDKILKVRPRRGKSLAFYTLYEDKNMIKEVLIFSSFLLSVLIIIVIISEVVVRKSISQNGSYRVDY
jgi:hypothetical protein